MTLKPLGNRVLVKQTEEETKTSSGIIIPDSSTEKPRNGKVVAIGDEVKNIAVDDIIVFGKFAGSEYKQDDEKYLIINGDDVLGIILIKE